MRNGNFETLYNNIIKGTSSGTLADRYKKGLELINNLNWDIPKIELNKGLFFVEISVEGDRVEHYVEYVTLDNIGAYIDFGDEESYYIYHKFINDFCNTSRLSTAKLIAYNFYSTTEVNLPNGLMFDVYIEGIVDNLISECIAPVQKK